MKLYYLKIILDDGNTVRRAITHDSFEGAAREVANRGVARGTVYYPAHRIRRIDEVEG